MFKKTVSNRIYEDLVEQIQNAILEGKLKAGDRLPSQRELVEKFQTSRSTLREALRVLEQKGLIEIKLGVSGGTIVKEINTEQISESLAFLIRHQKISLNELAEFREGVEGSVAALAAQRATDENINHLKGLIEKAKKLLDKGLSERKDFDRIDIQIHKYIANIAKNSVYKSVLNMIHDNIHFYYDDLPLMEENIMMQNYKNHCDILTAIEAKDSSRARLLMQNHVNNFNQYMKIEKNKKK